MRPDEAVAEGVDLDGNAFARLEKGCPGCADVIQAGQPGNGGIQHLPQGAGNEGLFRPSPGMVSLDDPGRYRREEFYDLRARAGSRRGGGRGRCGWSERGGVSGNRKNRACRDRIWAAGAQQAAAGQAAQANG